MKQREFNPAAFHLFNWKKKRDVHFTDRFFFSFHSICWTNHLHSCAKHGRTDGSEFILTTDLQTDTYFEEKTVNGKISFFFFFFYVSLFVRSSRSLPFLNFLQNVEDSSEAVLTPTLSNITDAAIKHWRKKKFYIYMHTFTCFVSLYLGPGKFWLGFFI